MEDIGDIQIIKSFRNSIAMHMGRDGKIVVKAPFGVPDFFIRKFLKNNEQWIVKRRKVLEKFPKIRKRQFVHGESFLYMGESYTLTIGPHKTIELKADMFLFPEFLLFRIQKEIVSWYQRQAKDLIISLVREYSERMGVSYTEIYFSITKSKWGSCSYDNKLQFNWHLIMAPPLVIRYVVIHELTHTMIKNHSSAFWKKVEQYNPSYRQQRKWLRDNGHVIQDI